MQTCARAGSVLLVATVGLLPTALPSAQALSVPALVIDDPGQLRAGEVTLSGRAGPGTLATSTVLYVLDVSGSTKAPSGQDCDGDGIVSGADDLNADGTVGDVLDCEIRGVQALNAALMSAPGARVSAGIMAFDEEAVVADIDPGPSDAPFVSADAPDALDRVGAVAAGVTRARMRTYSERLLPGTDTSYEHAIDAALDVLGSAPPGPRYLVLISDGRSRVSSAVLSRLRVADVRALTFAVADQSEACEAGSALAKIAGASGETCTLVADPAHLASGLAGTQSEVVSSVTLTVGSLTVATDVSAVGSWRAALRLGAGTYSVVATARLGSGVVLSVRRDIEVLSGAPGSAAPPDASVAPGGGALLATTIRAVRPRPTRAAVARVVTGTARVLAGAGSAPLATGRVALQGRASAGARWRQLGTAPVAAGRFTVRRHGRAGTRTALRVLLLPSAATASAVRAVQRPVVSACKMTRLAAGRSLVCRTSARSGAPVRLVGAGVVQFRSRVRHGVVELRSSRAFTGSTLVISLRNGRHIRLRL